MAGNARHGGQSGAYEPHHGFTGICPVPQYNWGHIFATECICRWMREGKDVDTMLPFLSAYMGHARFKDTAYYIHMVPDFYQRTGKIDVSAYDALLPEVYHEDQE